MNVNSVPLEDIAEIIMGQSPSGDTYNTTGEGLPFFQGKSEFGELHPTAVKWCSQPKKVALPNDILISVRAPVGPTNLADEKCCIGRGLAAIRPIKEIVDGNYLWLYLQVAGKFLAEKGQGSTFQAINAEDLKQLNIPLPPLKSQHHISEKLEVELEHIGKARKAAEIQLKDFALLRKRQNEKVEHLLKNVKRVALETLLINIEAGKSLKTSEQLARDNEYGILKVSAVSWSEFQPTEAKRFENDSYQPPDHHKVKKGDLIISRANTLELVGAAVYVDKDYPFRLLSDKTLRLVLQEDKILPEFLLCILRLSEARDHIESNATGSSDSMRNISQKTIRSIPVPLPDKDVQLKIIQLVKASRKLLGTAEQSAKQIIADTKLMPAKLLTQAFNH